MLTYFYLVWHMYYPNGMNYSTPKDPAEEMLHQDVYKEVHNFCRACKVQLFANTVGKSWKKCFRQPTDLNLKTLFYSSYLWFPVNMIQLEFWKYGYFQLEFWKCTVVNLMEWVWFRF